MFEWNVHFLCPVVVLVVRATTDCFKINGVVTWKRIRCDWAFLLWMNHLECESMSYFKRVSWGYVQSLAELSQEWKSQWPITFLRFWAGT
jgi:hypothetical protein